MRHQAPSSSRKEAIRALYEHEATRRDAWIEKADYFYRQDRQYMRFLVPEGQRVLSLGCGTGQLLASLNPAHGVGVDLSENMIARARERYPQYDFHVGDIEEPILFRELGESFDFVIVSDTIGLLDDCESALENIHRVCNRETRIIITYYSMYWGPALRLAETLGLKMPQPEFNWLSTEDIEGMLELADFNVVRKEWRILAPLSLFNVGTFINRYIATLPFVRRLCLRNYIVARPMRDAPTGALSASVVVPCRNEKGNIEAVIQRMPRFCDDLEIIFVEGNSQDGTFDETQRVAKAYPDWKIKVLKQNGTGKGDAVRKGFEHASGDVLMILDADLTIPPESLPGFYNALIKGKGNLINGSRLIYPMEQQAMRFLNMLANVIFSILFSSLFNQRITDTLCGTKVLRRAHYLKVVSGRDYFGDLDPFGDFDLLFGAVKSHLKIVEVPVRYRSRRYGETQISRFKHGWLLARMVLLAYRKLKAF